MSTSETPTTEELILSAKAALHDLITGAAVRSIVDQSGERIDFQKADVPSLRAYISELEREVQGAVSRPMGFYF